MARPLLFALGWIFVVLGIAGLVLPLMPGVLFLILAAACFTRSSPRFEAWLVGHRVLGPPVREWRETGSIPRSAKIFAAVSLAVSWALILLSGASAFVDVLTLALLGAVALYVVTRPSR
jgi:uncharacterized protein